MSNTPKPFIPVRGKDSDIRKMGYNEGYVYFAYDTGYIYLDMNGEKHALGGKGTGGGASFIWADAEEDINLFKINIDDDDDARYKMSVFSIEGSTVESPLYPQTGLMIINSDGRFFRVIGDDAENNQVIVLLIASANGTGSGGGTSSADLFLTVGEDLYQSAIFLFGQSKEIPITATSTKDDSGRIYITATDIETGKVYNFPEDGSGYQFQNSKIFKFNTNLLPESNNLTLTIRINSTNSTMRESQKPRRIIDGIKVVKIGLKKANEIAYLPLVEADDAAGTLNINYIPYGDASIPETLHVLIDGEETKQVEIPSSQFGKVVTLTIERQTHGVHEIELKASVELGGKTTYTDSIFYQGAWASPGETSALIWIGGYDPVVVNYESSYIKYMVYDPVQRSYGLPTTVFLYKDSLKIAELEVDYSTEGWILWDITDLYELGDQMFSIVCKDTIADISVHVTDEGSRDLGLVAKNTLLVNMTAAGRSSSEIKTTRNILESSTGNAQANLRDFNWQNNGWQDSEGPDLYGVDSGSYLSIANDAMMDIKLDDSIILNGTQDYTFELRFRVRNVQEYSTLVRVVPKYFYIDDEGNPSYIMNADGEVISGSSMFEEEIKQNGYTIAVDEYGNLLMDEENTTKTTQTEHGVVVKWLNDTGFGFCIGTQEAYFKTPSGVANVRYCENEVINLAIVVSKTDRLCYLYLNGILSGAAAMPSGTGASFTIGSDFEFNSKYCDFDLYRFRIYRLGLTMPQVIHNYLSDMHNIKLFDQNQITDPLDPTSLSYEELLKYNKNHPGELSMPYATWKITDGTDELLSWKKGNNRKTTVKFVNTILDEAYDKGEITDWYYYTHSPSFTADTVDLNVQGTSSQKYPRRNYKLKYKDAGETWIFTKGPLAGKPLNKEYYFNKNTGQCLPDVTSSTYDANTMKILTKNFHMDNETIGTNKFTWKIDYMESSATYNTGFANLMGNLVHPLYTKHPLDDYNLNIETKDMRTSVYGYPVLVFHEYADGTYEYIGRYNMNLDKGSNEYYGFELKNKQPYAGKIRKKEKNSETNQYEWVEKAATIKDVAECWELRDNQGTWCSFKYPSEEARNSGFMTYKDGTTGDNAQLEIVDHYEPRYSYFADEIETAASYTKFTDPNTQEEISGNGNINNWLYNKYANLEKVFNWLDSTNPATATNKVLSTPVEYRVSSTVSDNTITIKTEDDSLVPGKTYYVLNSEDNTFIEVNSPNVVNLSDYYEKVVFVNYESISEGLWEATFLRDTAEYRKEKFRNEFHLHIDKEYALTYFVLTELLLCYDSRGKNMHFASWGPQTPGGEYIWYPIFYDIDTQLGLNNSGAYLWDYDADVTKDNLFSTPTSVLWNNLYDVFYDDIVQKYRVLRGISNPIGADEKINGNLTYQNIIGAYECDYKVFDSYAMKGVRPIIAIGLDEYYKYLAPALTATDYANGKKYAGYYDTTGAHLYQQTPTYIYACQGDKKLTTELLLRNRLNYLDSWWLGGDYRAGVVENQIFIRANANHRDTSDLFLDSNSLTSLPDSAAGAGYKLAQYPQDYFDARPGAKIKPFLHQYVSYFMDNLPSVPKKYDGGTGQEDGIWTNVDSAKLAAFKTEPDLSQQITYIPGGDYISSLGDLSLMYPNSLQIFHGQRLLDFKLGSDIPGYKNPLINSSSDWSLAEMPLLKSVNISRLNQFNNELILTASKKLQEFRALGSIIERVNFAPGAPLHTVHLPNTMTTISLIENQNLNQILTTRPVIVESDGFNGYNFLPATTYRGLYLEDITDYNGTDHNGHKVSTLEINGGALGYNSYIILNNLIQLKTGATNNRTLGASLINVHWSPYDLVEERTPYDASLQYYRLTDHSNFEEYEYKSAEEWNYLTLNGKIFTYNSEYIESNIEETITDLSLLDTFIDVYAATNGKSESQFHNINSSFSWPSITGDIYICNTQATEIDESKLTSKYAEYWPNLNIYAKYIKESYIAKFVYVSPDSGKEQELKSYKLSTDTIHPNIPLDLTPPNRTNYDFIGWALSPDVTESSQLILEYVKNDDGTFSYNEFFSRDITGTTFNDTTNTVITLYAIFTPHEYKNTFNCDNGEILEINTPYSLTPGLNIPEDPYKPYDTPELEQNSKGQLGLYRVYQFKGWALSNNPEIVINTNALIANKDRSFVAVYEDVSVYDNVADEKFFEIINGTLRVKDEFKSKLKGKVTLPVFMGDKGYNTLGSLGGNESEITHIFFQNSTNENFKILQSSCQSMGKLVYFQMPATITSITVNTFQETSLGSVEDAQGNLVGQMFTVAKDIAASAFRNTPIKILDLGSAKHILQTNSLTGMRQLHTIRIGSVNNRSKITIDDIKEQTFTSTTGQNNGKQGKIYIYLEDNNEDAMINYLFDQGGLSSSNFTRVI